MTILYLVERSPSAPPNTDRAAELLEPVADRELPVVICSLCGRRGGSGRLTPRGGSLTDGCPDWSGAELPAPAWLALRSRLAHWLDVRERMINPLSSVGRPLAVMHGRPRRAFKWPSVVFPSEPVLWVSASVREELARAGLHEGCMEPLTIFADETRSSRVASPTYFEIAPRDSVFTSEPELAARHCPECDGTSSPLRPESIRRVVGWSGQDVVAVNHRQGFMLVSARAAEVLRGAAGSEVDLLAVEVVC